jgi:LPXTG-site transpeptidase (sortase) family protein
VGVSPTQSGWDITWLGHQIGWLNTTAYPTWQGNSVLTGHAVDADGLPSVFADLGNLKYGDQVIVHLDGLKYIYEVREVSRFVNPSDKSAFKHENASWLTLITCNGFNEETGEYRWRTVVKAVMVQVR